MKIKTFHVKISSVRENENFFRKCELLGFLVVVPEMDFKWYVSVCFINISVC